MTIDFARLDYMACREEVACLWAWGVTMAIGVVCVLVAHGLWCLAVCR